MRVFLTGGSGLIGSHVAEALRAAGHEVVALVRRTTDTRHLEEHGCALARGDVRDAPDELAPHLAGCTHAVHAAALVYAGDAWPKVRAANVEGTGNVLRAAAEAGVRHVVHVSSVAVYATAQGPIDETDPLERPIPPRDLYARSKREAELRARAVAAEEDLAVSMLRPAAVYGERDRLMAVRIGRMLRLPVSPILGAGDNTLPAVYAGNVASAVVAALAAERAGAVWNLAEDHPLTQRRLLEGIAEGMEVRARIVGVPAGIVLGAADLLERLGLPLPGAAHMPAGRMARLALGENPYRSEAIRSELGWRPPFELDEGLLRTGRWLRDHTPQRPRSEATR